MNKILKRAVIAIPVLAAAFYFIPIAAAIWLVCGIIDVLRNKARTPLLYNRYFFGNGVPTWLLSPFNLLVDLISYRNPGIYTLDDFPPAYRAEIEEVLAVFKTNKDRIIADIDAKFEKGRRGMYVYRWYGQALHRQCSGAEPGFQIYENNRRLGFQRQRIQPASTTARCACRCASSII